MRITPRRLGWFRKAISCVINRIKENHMIITIDMKKSFDHLTKCNNHPWFLESQQTRHRKEHVQSAKYIKKKKKKKPTKATKTKLYHQMLKDWMWKWKWSRSVVSNSLRPHGLQPTRLLRPWDFPGKSAGMDCHFLLQGICPTQEWNLGLPHCRQTLYCLSHQGSPRRLNTSPLM